MPQPINDVHARVLGSLIEKQLTVPESYPLTLNGLVNACNQKNNREPVVSYDEQTVMNALDQLRDRNLVYVFYGSTSRVPKYKHMVPSVYELNEAETALICVLMLRGPQTLGELRERTGRMYQFAGLGEVQETLDAMARREDPLVVRLERIAGYKESRYAHLLSGEVDAASLPPPRATGRVADDGRIDALETEVRELREEMASLKATFEEFRRQFE